MDLNGAFHKLALIADIEIADQTTSHTCFNRRRNFPTQAKRRLEWATRYEECRNPSG